VSAAPESLSAFIKKRLHGDLPAAEAGKAHRYMMSLLKSGLKPPLRVGGPDWRQIEKDAGIDSGKLNASKPAIKSLLELLTREIKDGPQSAELPLARAIVAKKRPAIVRRKRPGSLPRPIIEFPEAKTSTWTDVVTFKDALALHMERHGDTYWDLFRAVVQPGEKVDVKTIASWKRGAKSPRSVSSLRILQRIEHRYRLPSGYFKGKLPNPSRAAVGHAVHGISPSERRRLAWHLPDDFDLRPRIDKDEILNWVRNVVVSGATDYRRFQAKAVKQRYSVRFSGSQVPWASTDHSVESRDTTEEELSSDDAGVEVTSTIPAPPRLDAEMAGLISFKTSTLTEVGFSRSGVWGEATAQQKMEHIGLLFGALVASPKSDVKGLGVHPDRLSLGLLIFPALWDWYLNWRERRRGFYTTWEIDMLRVAAALTNKETGWITQTPSLALGLLPIKGLITSRDVALAQRDWVQSCEILHKHANIRAKEIQRVARVHRDPFEPLLAVLEAERPLAEYRKIADEVLRLMPNERTFPVATAEGVRSYLMLRLGMHLGLRQRNLRELLVVPKGSPFRSERQLIDLRRGEIRWNDREAGWEVFIPSAAFKNAGSSYFGNKPFRLLLPDLEGLYDFIGAYLDRHRAVLLRNAADPETFFVKTVKTSSKDAAYDQNSLYEAWRLIIQRYGVFNPYTGRGAIKGLLPHGPHSIRDVLATHILKCTGSYEQASYAIQDTPDMVAKHYGRFLPKDKAAIAAQVLNKVWAST
jgi:hypothetical protein